MRVFQHLDQQSYLVQSPANLPSCRSGVATIRLPGPQGTGLDFASVCRGIEAAQPGDAILVHTVCHNPTGVDLDSEQWNELLQRISDQQLYPIFDFAYQGFGAGLELDAEPIRRFASSETFNGEAFVCNSFSKNFNLYGERVGGISITGSTSEAATAMLSQLKSIVRTMYSESAPSMVAPL